LIIENMKSKVEKHKSYNKSCIKVVKQNFLIFSII